jgi:hypothetical protein
VFLHNTGPRPALIAAGRIAEALREDDEVSSALSFSLGVSGWEGEGQLEVSTLLAQAVRLVVFAVLSQRRARAAYPHGAVALLGIAAAAAAAIPQFLPPWIAAAAALPALGLLGLLAIRLGLLPVPRTPRHKPAMA